MAPSYLRFPPTENIQQRFWGCRARNPLCGLVSLETGAKIFAWGNIVYGAAMSILCGLLFLLPLFVGHHHTTQEMGMPAIKDLRIKMNKEKLEMVDENIFKEGMDKVYAGHSYAVIQSLLFVTFIVSTYWWYASYKLKKSLVERDLPILKKCFFIMLCLFMLLWIPYLIETELLWSRSFLFDFPIFILEIIGLIFTHAFIVNLISPESSQNDDLNRIQFNA